MAANGFSLVLVISARIQSSEAAERARVQGIDVAAQNGITLMVVLDCGVKAIEKVTYAKEKGVEVLVYQSDINLKQIKYTCQYYDDTVNDINSHLFNAAGLSTFTF